MDFVFERFERSEAIERLERFERERSDVSERERSDRNSSDNAARCRKRGYPVISRRAVLATEHRAKSCPAAKFSVLF